MNLRDIKKDIEYVVGEFIDDCSLFVSVNPGKSTEEVASLIEQAVDLYNDLKDRANTKVSGSNKAYYTEIRKDLLQKTDALYEKLSAVVKAK